MSQPPKNPKLTTQQQQILFENATEPPFSGEYLFENRPGEYRCANCGAALFMADRKYNSGSGWPSFDQAVSQQAVTLQPDHSHGLHRTEVRCANCDGHLGHLFEDSQTETGDYFCINSGALDFQSEAGTKR